MLGVRRNFGISSVFMYSVSLLDEAGKRLLVFHVERQEAGPIIAALNNVTLPRQETINIMTDTLKSLNCILEEVRIESHSMIPPLHNLCSCMLRWRTGEGEQEQALVKEFKASLLGKAPPFPEEDMERRKKDYLAFLLGEDAEKLIHGAADR